MALRAFRIKKANPDIIIVGVVDLSVKSSGELPEVLQEAFDVCVINQGRESLIKTLKDLLNTKYWNPAVTQPGRMLRACQKWSAVDPSRNRHVAGSNPARGTIFLMDSEIDYFLNSKNQIKWLAATAAGKHPVSFDPGTAKTAGKLSPPAIRAVLSCASGWEPRDAANHPVTFIIAGANPFFGALVV